MKNNTLAIALASLLVGGVAVAAFQNNRQPAEFVAADAPVVVRHGQALQSIDIVGQTLGHLACVIRSSDPKRAIDRIGMAELKARYPLSGGNIEVRELPGRPGVMNCVMHLQPHFQFDQMVTGFKLRTEMQAHGF